MRTSFFFGVGPFWDSFWYPYSYPYWYPYSFPYYSYPYYSYPYYSSPYYYGWPSTIVTSPPDVTYIESEPRQPAYYWYYCTSPKGYYPYVKECPQGWLKVVPEPSDSRVER